jgi:hypothetical protein
MPSHHINTVTLPTFNDVLSRYDSLVPQNLHHLDELRYSTIPLSVAHTTASPSLSQDEVSQLVEWKLCVPLLPR